MPFSRSLRPIHTNFINKVALHFAGHAAFADLEHVGRRTGVVHHTPVRAFRAVDKVVIGINFGLGSDWVKNILAAGGCRMRLGNEQLQLGTPRVVPVKTGIEGLPWLFGTALKYLVHTTDCLVMSVIATTPQKQGARGLTGSGSPSR